MREVEGAVGGADTAVHASLAIANENGFAGRLEIRLLPNQI